MYPDFSKLYISEWLSNTLQSHENNIIFDSLPSDNCWDITKLHADQREVVLQVVSKLKEWIEWDGKTTFVPLKIIVHGRPGTGKSVVIKTLYSISYRIFGLIAYSLINAPTGGSAYNANGKTCH